MSITRPWARQVKGTGVQRQGNPRSGTTVDPDTVNTALWRARRGDPPIPINAPERRAVIATLTADGWTAAQIATALGMAQRNVVRHRSIVRGAEEVPRANPANTTAKPPGPWVTDPARACAPHPDIDPEWFFPKRDASHPDVVQALAICRTCPMSVLRRCREYALAEPSVHGIWGGTTARMRRQLRRNIHHRLHEDVA